MACACAFSFACQAPCTPSSGASVTRGGAKRPCRRVRPLCDSAAGNSLIDQAIALADSPAVLLNVAGRGPGAALALLSTQLPSDAYSREAYRLQARRTAILGSCPKSRDSYKSGLRAFARFVELVLGSRDSALPPSLDLLLEWSHTFRCVGTFTNYLGYVRTACVAMDVEMAPAGHPALLHAKSAIVKRMLFSPRPVSLLAWLRRGLVITSRVC